MQTAHADILLRLRRLCWINKFNARARKYVRKKNGFAEVFLKKFSWIYRSENNFNKLSKQLSRTLKLVARMLKIFVLSSTRFS